MICNECEKEIQDDIISSKQIIALNKKFHGRQVNRYFCADCLSESLEVDKNGFVEMIENFKNQGCTLF